MLTLSCLCGRVRIDLAGRPDFIHACNCTLCSKSGARWSYFPPESLTVTGQTGRYRREDKDDPAAEIHFCMTCGSTTHFRLTESAVARHGDVQAGVNMLLADERDLAGIELRFPNGRDWSGGPEFGYARAPVILGSECAAG